MPLYDTLLDAWRQVLVDSRTEVDLGGIRAPVRRTRSAGLRMVTFAYEGHPIEGIEQNPETRSRWAQLAREGKTIMQFKCGGRYFANVCDGTVMRYPAWASLGLPE